MSVFDGTIGSPEPGKYDQLKYLQPSVQLQDAAHPFNVSPSFVQIELPCDGPSHCPVFM